MVLCSTGGYDNRRSRENDWNRETDIW